MSKHVCTQGACVQLIYISCASYRFKEESAASLPLCVCVCVFQLSIVQAIKCVFNVCCDATLTFTWLAGKLCKQLGAEVIRMRAQIRTSAIILFVCWPLEDSHST